MLREISLKELEGISFPFLFYFDGKVIGKTNKDSYLTKRTEKQIYRKFNSIGIDKEVLDMLEGQGVSTIYISLIKDNKVKLYENHINCWLKTPDSIISYNGREQRHLFIPKKESLDMEITPKPTNNTHQFYVGNITPQVKDGEDYFIVEGKILLNQEQFGKIKWGEKIGVMLDGGRQ